MTVCEKEVDRMKLHFYGTSASEGVPALFCECESCEKLRKKGGKNLRTRTAAQVDDDLLIDCSMDLYAQTLFRGLDLRKIRYALVTHSHEDHYHPISLTTIKPPMASYSRERHLDLYANKTAIGKIIPDLIHFPHPAPLTDYINFHTVSLFETFSFDAYTVTALPANHDEKEDCFIYVIQKGGKTLLYGHDSGLFSEATWKALGNYRFDCVVLDCTMVDTTGRFPSHMGLPDNVAVRERMLREGIATENTRFLATHFAHIFDPDHDRITPIFAEKGFIAAYDGLTVEF